MRMAWPMVRHAEVPLLLVGRNLWTTRLLPLHLGMVAAVLGCLVFGQWQYARYSQDSAGQVLVRSEPAVPLPELLSPGAPPGSDALAREVTARGSYLPGGQVLLPDRELDGRRGFWLLAPFQVEGGAVATVVRGWVDAAGAAEAAPPAGTVTLTGRVQRAEPVDDAADSSLPPGQVSAASPVEFVDRVDGDLYAALVVLSGESPAPSVVPAPVEIQTRVSSSTAGLQNLAYALQWVLFAAFAVFMWWRWLPRPDDEDGGGTMDPNRTTAVRTAP